jgi:hypothetical protein
MLRARGLKRTGPAAVGFDDFVDLGHQADGFAEGEDSGLSNAKGAGFSVPTQKDRGHFYENFTLGLLQNKNVIGWHWFRYIDDGDLKTKGQSSNKGIVNIEYQEYSELAESMKVINSQAYSLSDYFRKTQGSEPTKQSDAK